MMVNQMVLIHPKAIRMLARPMLYRFAIVVLGGSLCSQLFFTNVANADEQLVESEAIETLLVLLGDKSYSNREEAFSKLQQNALAAIPLIEQRLTTGMNFEQAIAPEAALRMVRLLSEWSSEPETSPGREALEALRRVATVGSTLTSARAQNTLSDLTIRQSVTATNRLRQLGVFIDNERVQIVTAQLPHYLMKLDDSYRGTSAELSQLRWLIEVEMVRLTGVVVDHVVLENVVALPNLKILQLRDVNLSVEDFELLTGVRKLETLEILYSPIDSSFVPILSELPVTSNLRLFGTKLTDADIEMLSENLDGVEIIHGKGGFLGISSESINSTVVGQVTPGGGAAVAGIRSGDKLTSIQGVPIFQFEDLRRELGKFPVGEDIKVVLERPVFEQNPGNFQPLQIITKEVTVKLGQQP